MDDNPATCTPYKPFPPQELRLPHSSLQIRTPSIPSALRLGTTSPPGTPTEPTPRWNTLRWTPPVRLSARRNLAPEAAFAKSFRRLWSSSPSRVRRLWSEWMRGGWIGWGIRWRCCWICTWFFRLFCGEFARQEADLVFFLKMLWSVWFFAERETSGANYKGVFGLVWFCWRLWSAFLMGGFFFYFMS